ncbi:uncharacterized protein Z519_11138 [Cladophialophora bantiana CBS 173.52]|uniref:Uncharacterized protein n=1 Tax=Cladophialophora bantiana (strain ATCC 10958 / CBS 173.52 / CDC B-1940 / NIH 8579) TaxID=1442370 RepID=A0A0D2H444_CLAB1|nr:uncharacterized protein Z519_11138 [Cladophialophora bantiana CBS 173.52]KIW88028.1 hypothetical protein Z519_11138 [Cladophialophora bantiana CBS 173.52]
MVYVECVKIRATGLLYANKRFYKEFIHFLREMFVLGFHIDPSAPSTAVKLINSDNSQWGNDCTIDTPPHPDYGMLDRMPVDRFRGIRILIDAPDVTDPGQLFRVRHRESRGWRLRGAWNRSVPNYSSWDAVTKTASIRHEGSNSDLGIILRPFSRIRYADAVTIELRRNAPRERPVNNLKANLVKSCRKRSFGLDLRPEAEWNDDDTLALEDALHVWLDYLLDDMGGPTAALLRRDRFKFWCSGYEYQGGRHFHGFVLDDREIGSAEGYLDEELFDHIKQTCHDRFMSAREHTSAPPGFWFSSHELKRLGWLAEVGEEDTFWETRYPAGIEPKSRNHSWIDTAAQQQPIDTRFRLEPPEHDVDTPACQIFPPYIGGCPSCNLGDRKNKLLIMLQNNHLRNILFHFNARPEEARLLGPIVE